jgi:tetratricopeptide (TPR) repeat protein
MKRTGIQSLVVLLLSVLPVLAGGNVELQRAEEQYQRTDYAAVLKTLLTYSPKTAAVDALIGKSYYMDGQFKKSAAYFEAAVAEDPLNSTYFDWLGRAYGRRAEQASFLTALPFATKTRESFERAVALDSRNLEALGDLFEYYLQAPGVVGGGIDKAGRIAGRISELSEPEAHYVRARIAEKRNRPAEAECEYRKARESAPDQVGRLLDLATFLSNQGRIRESDDLFEIAEQTAPESPKVMFARASAYVHANRNLPAAEKLIRQSAQLPHTPDDPTRLELAHLVRKVRELDPSFK